MTAKTRATEAHEALHRTLPAGVTMAPFDPACALCDAMGRPTLTLARFRIEHPAASGEMIQQGHADACARYGHGVWVIDGVRQPTCSRCGEPWWPADGADHPAPVRRHRQ